MLELDLKISEIKNMLKEVQCITGINFSEYAFSFLKRRTEVFMRNNKIISDSDFIYKINKSPGIAGNYLESIFVSDSEMFRDFEMWDFLLEKIFSRYSDHSEIKIHLPYCTGGDELYSLLFLLEHFNNSQNIEIIVSAVTDVHLQKIKKGEFNNNQVKASAKNIDTLNFIKDTDGVYNLNNKSYFVNQNFKGKLTYEVCEFFKEKHINEFDIVLCRNKMIYFNSNLKEKALKTITRSIKKGSYLIVGAGELLDDSNKKKYKQIKSYHIFKKKTIA